MNVFECLKYREIILRLVKLYKKQRPGWTLQRLAQQTQIQPPYLTNVLKGRAHLSADQLYAIAEVFALSPLETEYALLLLEWERTGLERRKLTLLDKIETIRKARLKTEVHLKANRVEAPAEDMTRFYINPELQLIYAFLGIPRFSENLNLIAESLNIEPDRVEAMVRELREMGFIKMTSKGFEKTKRSLHLPSDSPLCAPQQLLMHYRALQHQQLLAKQEKYGFAVTFTADEATRNQIQDRFFKFLSSIEELVKNAPSEAVYQMHFDLFPWSR